MATFLASQIGLLEQEPLSPGALDVEDLIAFSLTALERLESHLKPGGLSECDRPLVPLFQRWLLAAGKVKELARGLRTAGERVSGCDDLLRAMNRSKPVAESFDYFVDLNCRLAGTDGSPNGG
jgi:hypothetical protein